MPPMTAPVEQIRKAFLARVPAGRSLADNTNFFEAGFTSVLLAGVLSELLAADIRLRMVDLFRYPTLLALTAEVTARLAAEGPVDGRRGDAGRRRLPWQT
jgi:aryl carrier-like protein